MLGGGTPIAAIGSDVLMLFMSLALDVWPENSPINGSHSIEVIVYLDIATVGPGTFSSLNRMVRTFPFPSSQLRPATSPHLHRRHSAWPSDRRHHPTRDLPSRTTSSLPGQGARCTPAQIRQVKIVLGLTGPLPARVTVEVAPLTGRTASSLTAVRRRTGYGCHQPPCVESWQLTT